MPKAYKKFNEIHEGKALHGKMIYDSINNFIVNTSTIFITAGNNINAITFKVERSLPNGFVENLVLVSDFNGDYIAQLYQYELTAEELEDFEHGIPIVSLDEKLKITALEDFDASLFNRNEAGTPQIYALGDVRCGIFLRAEEVNGEIVTVFLIVPCSGGGSTSGNNSSGTGGSSGSGYNWGFIFNDWRNNGGVSSGVTSSDGLINLPNDPNNYYFSINTPIISLLQNDVNISDLNNFSVNSIIKPKFFELSAEYNGTTEYGWEFRVNNKGGYVPVEAQVVYTSTGGAVQFPAVQANTVLRMHLHYNGLDPVFSEDDLIGMFSLFVERNQLNPTDSNKVTSILVTAGTTVYALRVDDLQKVQTFFDDIISDPVKLELFKRDYKFQVIHKAKENAIPNNYEDRERLFNIYLAQLFGDNYLETGLVLYKAELNLTNNTVSSWTKVN